MYHDANRRSPFKKCATSVFGRKGVVAVTGKRCLRKNHLAEIFQAEAVAFNPYSFGITVTGGRE
jgi:hypothetical protein